MCECVLLRGVAVSVAGNKSRGSPFFGNAVTGFYIKSVVVYFSSCCLVKCNRVASRHCGEFSEFNGESITTCVEGTSTQGREIYWWIITWIGNSGISGDTLV